MFSCLHVPLLGFHHSDTNLAIVEVDRVPVFQGHFRHSILKLNWTFFQNLELTWHVWKKLHRESIQLVIVRGFHSIYSVGWGKGFCRKFLQPTQFRRWLLFLIKFLKSYMSLLCVDAFEFAYHFCSGVYESANRVILKYFWRLENCELCRPCMVLKVVNGVWVVRIFHLIT